MQIWTPFVLRPECRAANVIVDTFTAMKASDSTTFKNCFDTHVTLVKIVYLPSYRIFSPLLWVVLQSRRGHTGRLRYLATCQQTAIAWSFKFENLGVPTYLCLSVLVIDNCEIKGVMTSVINFQVLNLVFYHCNERFRYLLKSKSWIWHQSGILKYLDIYDPILWPIWWCRNREGVFTWGQKCTIRMIIRVTVILMTVFWPVCMQISITKANLNCAIQMMVRRCFPVTHISQIMQRNRHTNALTSKLCFEGRATRPSNHFRQWTLHFLIEILISSEISISISKKSSHTSSPPPSCVLLVIQISQKKLQFFVAISNLVSCKHT